MDKLALLPATLGLILCFYGWGAVVCRGLRFDLPGDLFPVVGAAALIVIGGPLIAIGLGGVFTIVVLLVAGVIAGGWSLYCRAGSWYRRGTGTQEQPYRSAWRQFLPYAMAAAGLALLFYLNVHPSAFNYHDDFEKYFKYPVRLLQTGTLDTGPFDTLGSTALGGMSFLHGFALTVGPIAFISVVDGVIGPFLGLMALVTVLHRQGASWMACNGACLLFLAIDPLSINVSAHYLGAALLLLAALVPLLRERVEDAFEWRPAALIALAYAALIAAKTTLAFLVPIHYVAVFLCGLVFAGDRRGWIARSWRIPALSTLFALPWFIVHAGKYRNLALGNDRGVAVPELPPELEPFLSWRDFSMDAMFYGFHVTPMHYTGLLALLAAVTVIAALMKNRFTLPVRLTMISMGATALSAYLVGMHWIAPRLAGGEAGMRYLVPVFLAATCVFGLAATMRSQETGERVRRLLLRVSGTALAVLILAFMPSLFGRVSQGVTTGSTIGIPDLVTEDYVRYCDFILGDLGREWIASAQKATPEGATVMLWTMASANFDYRRNRAFDVDPAGIAADWHAFPFAGTLNEQSAYLRDAGVDYVIWQYAGSGVRTEEDVPRVDPPMRIRLYALTLKMTHFLAQLSDNDELAETVFDDGLLRVIRLKPVHEGREGFGVPTIRQ